MLEQCSVNPKLGNANICTKCTLPGKEGVHLQMLAVVDQSQFSSFRLEHSAARGQVRPQHARCVPCSYD